MEEIKVKKKKPLFSRFEWICIIIFAVFGIVGLILHFLGYDDIKGNAAEVQSLASQTDYLLVSKNDPYIMIGTPDPDGELPVDVLKVDAYGFYNFFKVPTNINLTPFPITLEAWNYLFNQLFGQPASNKNDGTVLMRYRMSAGNLDEFTGYMPVTIISHQDYYVVKATLYAASGAVAWLSTNNYIKASPVPRLSGSDLYNVYYFYVNENGSPHYYAVSSGGVLNLHRASSDDATARITYRDGMVLYSYESNGWQGPINGSQSYFDSLGVPYVFNFENTAGMLKYDDECMCAVRMMSFEDQQSVPTPTPSPSVSPTPESPAFSVIVKNRNDYFLYDVFADSRYISDQSLTVNNNSNNALSFVMSNYNVNNVFSYSVWYSIGHYSFGTQAFLYFPCDSISAIKEYSLGSSLSSSDFDFLRNNYNSVDYISSYYGFDVDLKLGYVRFVNSSGWGVSLVNSNGLNNLNLVGNLDYSPGFSVSDGFLNYSIGNLTNPLVRAYVYGLYGTSVVAPTPDPNATPTPTPSPTPTEPPHVIINFPSTTPTPTPTPVIVFNPNFPSGVPLGSDSMDSVLDDGGSLLSGNAVAVLSRAISFFPAILMKLWWFWIFLLIIVATIRAFVHFTG